MSMPDSGNVGMIADAGEDDDHVVEHLEVMSHATDPKCIGICFEHGTCFFALASSQQITWDSAQGVARWVQHSAGRSLWWEKCQWQANAIASLAV